MSKVISQAVRLVLIAVLGTFTTVGIAETFPVRPVRLVVPFPPGGPSDILGRVLAEKLSQKWKQSVIVENKPGGLTRIATMDVMRTPADGYTLLIGIDATFAMNPFLYSKPGYDPLKDFTHITLIATQSLVLLANKTTPVDSVAALISYAKKHPGEVNFGSATTSTQLTGELFKRMAGVDMTYVPYKGNSEVTRGMLGGDIQVSFDGIAANAPYVKNGQFLALATTGLRRTPAMPDVPTLDELGLKNFEVRVWNGLSAPAGVPRPIVDKIQADVKAVLEQKDIKDKLLTLGLETVGSSSKEYVDTIKRDSEKYAPLIKELGLRID